MSSSEEKNETMSYAPYHQTYHDRNRERIRQQNREYYAKES